MIVTPLRHDHSLLILICQPIRDNQIFSYSASRDCNRSKPLSSAGLSEELIVACLVSEQRSDRLFRADFLKLLVFIFAIWNTHASGYIIRISQVIVDLDLLLFHCI